MIKHFGRIAVAVLATLALSLGMAVTTGAANAASSTSACASQQAAVAKAKHKVAKDKKKLKKAKRHHHHKAAKKARKHLKRDRKKLARANNAYRACMNRADATPPASPSPSTPPANPVTEQCNTAAAPLVSQDPTGTFADGAAAFCDLLGQLAGTSGGDPVSLCNQLASQDPTGQMGQLCTGLGSLPI